MTAQSVLLYERLAKVVEQLVNGVEDQIHRQMEEVESKVQMTSDKLGQLNPQVDNIHDGIKRVERMLSQDVGDSIKVFFSLAWLSVDE